MERAHFKCSKKYTNSLDMPINALMLQPNVEKTATVLMHFSGSRLSVGIFINTAELHINS